MRSHMILNLPLLRHGLFTSLNQSGFGGGERGLPYYTQFTHVFHIENIFVEQTSTAQLLSKSALVHACVPVLLTTGRITIFTQKIKPSMV